MPYANNKDADQPAHSRSLISVFVIRCLDSISCGVEFLSTIIYDLLQFMVLGSFQCRGVLLLWHIVGQGPAVLAAGAGQVGCFFLFFFHLVYPIFFF